MPQLISPVKGASSDSETSSNEVNVGNNFTDLEDVEELIAPPNSPVYEDMGFLTATAQEAVAVQQQHVNICNGYASMDFDHSQDFRAAVESQINSDAGYASLDLDQSQDFRAVTEF